MKGLARKVKSKKKDEYLFGLLASYKSNHTYIKILESEEKGLIALFLTDNPKNWSNVPEDKFSSYRELRRLEIGADKLSLKFLLPEQIVRIRGPLLNIKIPPGKVEIINSLSEGGFYILEAPVKYKQKILIGVNKILNLSPQKKYEIIEKCLAESQEL